MELWSPDPDDAIRMLPPPPSPEPGVLDWERRAEGFLLRERGKEILLIDPSGRFVTRRGGSGSPELCLKWAAPHMRMLRNRPVIHAASLRIGRDLVAFCGGTGSGKSSIHRSFREAAGIVKCSEDLLPLGGEPLMAEEAGEEAIRRWARENAARFERGDRVDGPEEAGPTLQPLACVYFLDPARRTGRTISAEPLEPIDAFILHLRNSFAELGRGSCG